MLSATIVVPTYNRPVALNATLDALDAMDFPSGGFDVLVVDSSARQSGAKDITVEHGARYAAHSDAGVAAARNQGARLAIGELLLFVDDDIVVKADNLTRHAAHHSRNPRCLVSGRWEFDPTVRTKLETTALGRYRLGYEDAYNRPHGVAEGAEEGHVNPLTLAAGNLSVRRDVFWSLGGFDEDFPVGAEDQDFSWRARRAGCTLIYDYDIEVAHNDQHADLSAVCSRLERAATGLVYFATKNPDAPPPPMLKLNGPVHRGDSARLVARKLARGLLSLQISLWVVRQATRAAELLRPDGGWPLESLYKALAALYVFRGVRRGLALVSGGFRAHAHRPS